MLSNIFSSEILKIRRLRVWIVIILGSIIAVVLALTNFFNNYDIFMQPGDNPWLEAWTQVDIFMGSFILPILSGIYTALVCRTEHIGGGWKQILSLPISRSKTYICKFLLSASLMAITQFILLTLFLILGHLTGIKSDIPWLTLVVFGFRGWLASFPLIAIQLIFSFHWDNFGIPIAVNIVFTLPSLFIVNTKLGQFYPWAQPMLAMSPPDESPISSIPVFYLMLLITFALSMLIGIRNFNRKDI
ncbi:ABC transporter permease [Clostridium sp. MSJ-11]|uniref:ABC transporter permease n=1 Tax=Clostridium mobile TaxID=2841512 RepID=A0ABS6EEH9_9CLOT|nr:ABC transporter permease [Clostridium mobile]MBU5483425.1 ABC transporter permease [Clostridium mobile]